MLSAKSAPQSPRWLFAYSYWDSLPVLAGVLHAASLIAFCLSFDHLGWGTRLLCGVLYALSISWNINSVAHNFIHNPYFKSALLNRAFSLLESITLLFSQTFYDAVHKRHHVGNSDRLNAQGDTIDWLSIYRYGQHGEAENVWAYTFKSYFRDAPATIYRVIHQRSPSLAKFGLFEIAVVISLVLLMASFNWVCVLFLAPFYYLGHCLSSLNGYYEHWRGNPELPIAWGVSCYNRWYNWLWFNNGYHAEHHYRPKQHWTRMKVLHEQIAEQQQAAGVHVIKWSHGLGFLQAK